MPVRIVLASSSAHRVRLLARLGIAFETDAAHIDETQLPGESAGDMVLRLSETKATVVGARQSGAIVIGSDQAGVLDGRVLGKPLTRDAACAQLRAASGRDVVFLTGLCVLDTRTGARRSGIERCTVRFRRLREGEIADYVDRERPLDCAGSFRVEGLGIALFRSLELSDPTALEGLALIRLCEYLAELGAPVLRA